MSSADPATPARVPRHVAIIMDGNGRWALSRGWQRSLGHMQGAARVKEIVREADRLGIAVLTLYCFSTENWGRPSEEISALMELLREYLLQERQELYDNNIRLQSFGDITRIPEHVRLILQETIEATRQNTGMILNFCLNYGGRAELLRGIQDLCRQVEAGQLSASAIDEQAVANSLYTAGLPDPDLLIRTSGEFRISNFLLWQIAYAEIYITETLWPDFEPQHLRSACEAYAQRKRRFGHSDEASVENTDKASTPDAEAMNGESSYGKHP